MIDAIGSKRNIISPQRIQSSSWGALRFWNDNEIAPNGGFPPHFTPTWKSSRMFAMERSATATVQVMSAGTGIRHAEFNLEPKTTIGDSCRITLHQLADCLLYRRSTAL